MLARGTKEQQKQLFQFQHITDMSVTEQGGVVQCKEKTDENGSEFFLLESLFPILKRNKVGRYVYDNISSIHHVCDAYNAALLNIADTDIGVIQIIREVQANEEITISFVNTQVLTEKERRAVIEERWGFTCTCDMCSNQRSVRERDEKKRIELYHAQRAGPTESNVNALAQPQVYRLCLLSRLPIRKRCRNKKH